MLLPAGADYPPHRHTGLDELHLLHRELIIDDTKLQAGEFVRAESGSVDSFKGMVKKNELPLPAWLSAQIVPP